VLFVVEVKSVVPDNQAAILGLDRKSRLAPGIAAERGWHTRAVAKLLVVSATATSRRRVARLRATYDAVFPIRGAKVRSWLRSPAGAISGLLFVPYVTRGDQGEVGRVWSGCVDREGRSGCRSGTLMPSPVYV
jgi:hypothetical protein